MQDESTLAVLYQLQCADGYWVAETGDKNGERVYLFKDASRDLPWKEHIICIEGGTKTQACTEKQEDRGVTSTNFGVYP